MKFEHVEFTVGIVTRDFKGWWHSRYCTVIPLTLSFVTRFATIAYSIMVDGFGHVVPEAEGSALGEIDWSHSGGEPSTGRLVALPVVHRRTRRVPKYIPSVKECTPMSQDSNKRVRLASRPDGEPDRSDFEVIEEPIPTPKHNEVLVKTRFLSVDPYMRSRMRESWPVGAVMKAGAVGVVSESNADGFDPGDVVTGSNYLQQLEWAEYTIATPSQLRPVNTGSAPISTALGVLGMPGRTAYFGMLDVGSPKPGETVVVSGAAGAVGSVAGQIASLAGCRVVGIAGSPAKVDWMTGELGFDAAVNYRSADPVGEALESACPAGVDVYFDNVGGVITDAVVSFLNPRSRVAVCGQIAHYNDEEIPAGPRVLPQLQYTRIENFTVSDFTHRYDEADQRLREWVTSESLSYRETITDGLEHAPDAFLGLFEGENTGKQLVKVA